MHDRSLSQETTKRRGLKRKLFWLRLCRLCRKTFNDLESNFLWQLFLFLKVANLSSHLSFVADQTSFFFLLYFLRLNLSDVALDLTWTTATGASSLTYWRQCNEGAKKAQRWMIGSDKIYTHCLETARAQRDRQMREHGWPISYPAPPSDFWGWALPTNSASH